MNIFILHAIASVCARYHCDRHVCKMIIESGQMLSTAHHHLDGVDSINGTKLYKKAHLNHPCTIWTRKTSENYKWHYSLFVELCNEYTYRYGKIHETDRKLRSALEKLPDNIPEGEMTEFALAMPEEYKIEGDPIASYRKYYNMDKKKIFSWKKRDAPEWIEWDVDVEEEDEEEEDE